MSEPILVALIVHAGVALGGILTGRFQRSNTKTLVSAEFRKLEAQLKGDAKKRLLGRKQDWIMETHCIGSGVSIDLTALD